MKSTVKTGFTLVELMIVIAIIGVLAASLFPMMSGYMAKSRDTARTAHLANIATAMQTYYADFSSYPAHASNCVSTDSNFVAQMQGKVPTDTVKWAVVAGCTGTNGEYAYGTGNVNSSTPSFYLAARFENATGGNTGSLTSVTAANMNTQLTSGEISKYVKGGANQTGYAITR